MTVMTICHIHCAVKTPLHRTSFSANNKARFQVLEFALLEGIFFKTKNLWKLRLQRESFLSYGGSSGSNSKLLAFLVILPNDHHLLQSSCYMLRPVWYQGNI